MRYALTLALTLLASIAEGQPVLTYKAYFDAQLAANIASINSAHNTCGGNCFYALQYYQNATLDMFEATQDNYYLNVTYDWMEGQMNNPNKIVGVGGCKVNYYWWPGATDLGYASPTPTTSRLDEISGMRAWGRAIRLVKTNSTLENTTYPGESATFGARATALQDFWHTHMITKWEVCINSTYFNNMPFDDALGDKPAMTAHILLEFARVPAYTDKVITGSRTYTSYANNILTNYAARISAPTFNGIAAAGAEIWDFQMNPSDATNHSYDTSHANRIPSMLIAAKLAGRPEIPSDHAGKVGNLFHAIMWNQSISNPQFTNYVDGVNEPYDTTPAWANGQVYSGWVRLASIHSGAFIALKAMLDCVIATCGSLSRPANASIFGRLALSGGISYAEWINSQSGGGPAPDRPPHGRGRLRP